jgi:PGF-pre-PGF domain-containing protein
MKLFFSLMVLLVLGLAFFTIDSSNYLTGLTIGLQDEIKIEPVVTEPMISLPQEPAEEEPVISEPVISEPVISLPVISLPVEDERVIDPELVDEEPVLDISPSEPVFTLPVLNKTLLVENTTSSLRVPNNVTEGPGFILQDQFKIFALPSIDTIFLNTTDLTINGTNQNITAYTTSSDGDGEDVKVIYNWLLNGTPIAVLNMPFEAINGTNTSNAWDYSGYGNIGNITNEASNATFNSTGGYDGKGAYKFDGINDVITISSNPSFLIKTNRTISAWVKVDGTGKTRGIINTRPASGSEGYVMRIDSSDQLDVFHTGGGQIININFSLYQGKWTHLVWTASSNTGFNIYINGVLNSSDVTATDNANFDSNDLYLGLENAVSSPFNGTIDELMIFNRSLSASQIHALWQNRTDLISANETTTGQNWTVDATPNDGNEDGSLVRSNQVIVTDLVAPQTPVLTSVNLNQTAEFNKSFHIVTEVTDDNLVSVNFTVIDPDGIILLDNENATSRNDTHWLSRLFVLNKSSSYNYSVVASDSDGLQASQNADITFLIISGELNASTVLTSSSVKVSGVINFSNGSFPAVGTELNIYLNGTEQCDPINSTGGTKTTDGDYTIHAFTSNGTFNFSENFTGTFNAEVLIVAGGGGGGWHHGGGGGGGGVVHDTALAISDGSYVIVVGPEGTSPGGDDTFGNNGGDSIAFGLNASGGGGGGYYSNNAGKAGGSGGGGGGSTGSGGSSDQTDNTASSGTRTVYGNSGGTRTGSGGNTNGNGGGAGGASNATHGGPGHYAANFISFGSSGYFGGGGGAGNDGAGNLGTHGGGNGGAVGGGAGTAATNNTGSGGGGGGGSSGDGRPGGAGIVLIRYLTSDFPSVCKTNSTGGYTLNFTAPGSGGTYDVIVNLTYQGYFGTKNLSLVVQQAPVLNSVNLNQTAQFNKSFHIVTEVTDDNLVSVNFTVIDPNGVILLDNENATSRNDTHWLSRLFVLNKSSSYNYSVVATDADGLQTSQNANISFLLVSGELNSSIVFVNSSVKVSGVINFSNGTFPDVDTEINIYLNGTAQTTTNAGSGDGSDGVLTVSSANTVINNYTYLTTNESVGNLTITVSDASNFSVADEILVIQMQNSTVGTAGLYEFVEISSISGNNITLTSALVNTYYTINYDSTSAVVTQVVRVPEYTSVTVNSGANITAKAWDGYSGGIVVFRATGTVDVNGSIDVIGKGFREHQGGGFNPFQGEGIHGLGTQNNQDNVGGGGASGNCAGGASGGGHATDGEAGTAGSCNSQPGKAKGIADLSLIILGPAGGGSHRCDEQAGAECGGEGSGIIIIFANEINVSGTITSSGEAGGFGAGGANYGAGGGAGGSIFLEALTLGIGNNKVTSLGGIGYKTDNDGGDGSVGRILLNYSTLSGSTNPSSGFNGTYVSSSTSIKTNSTGGYTKNITAPGSGGTFDVVVNLTYQGYFGTKTIYLDVKNELTIPLLSVYAPIDGTAYNYLNTSTTPFELNFTASDETSLETCWYTLNGGSKVILTDCKNTTIALNEGQHNLTVYANDSSNNINNSGVINFTIDSTSPLLTLANPTNSTNFTVNRIDFNFTVQDSLSLVSTCWYSLSNFSNFTINNCQNTSVFPSVGNHYLILYVNDTVNNVNSTFVNFTINSAVLGDKNNVTVTGITSLNISVNGRPITEASGNKELIFKDDTTLLINFTFNFSKESLNLSKITITKDATSIIVNLSGQLQANQTKNLYLSSGSFSKLCVKDKEIASVTAISSACTGEAEFNFDACLGVSTGTRLGNITCYDDGTIIRVENLSFSGVRAGVSTSSSSSSSSSSAGSGAGGGGGGGSGRKKADISNSVAETWVELQAGELATLLVDDQDLSITDISFTVNEYTYGAKLELIKKDGLPGYLNRFKGPVYRVLELSSLNLEGKVDETYSINFRVPFTWLEENNLFKKDIKLYHYDGFRWVELPTLFGENDATHTQFSSDTKYLGFFVIGTADSVFAGETKKELVEGEDFITLPDGEVVLIQKPSNLTNALIILGTLLFTIIAAIIIKLVKRKKKRKRKKNNHKNFSKRKRKKNYFWLKISLLVISFFSLFYLLFMLTNFMMVWHEVVKFLIFLKYLILNIYNGNYRITYQIASLALAFGISLLIVSRISKPAKKGQKQKK